MVCDTLLKFDNGVRRWLQYSNNDVDLPDWWGYCRWQVIWAFGWNGSVRTGTYCRVTKLLMVRLVKTVQGKGTALTRAWCTLHAPQHTCTAFQSIFRIQRRCAFTVGVLVHLFRAHNTIPSWSSWLSWSCYHCSVVDVSSRRLSPPRR
jgi:hypothetical protein